MPVRAQLHLRRATLAEARPGEDMAWGGLPEGQGWRREGVQGPLGGRDGDTPHVDWDAFMGGVFACVHSLSQSSSLRPRGL